MYDLDCGDFRTQREAQFCAQCVTGRTARFECSIVQTCLGQLKASAQVKIEQGLASTHRDRFMLGSAAIAGSSCRDLTRSLQDAYALRRFPPKNLPIDSGEIPDFSEKVGDLGW